MFGADAVYFCSVTGAYYNYLFDTLTEDVFRVRSGKLEEGLAVLRSDREQEPDLSDADLMGVLGKGATSQGDGILIETPSGRQVLIDGGASPQALFAELGEVMPFWDREIDLLLLTLVVLCAFAAITIKDLLAAARSLRDLGLDVRVFDKGREIGRASCRERV